MGYVEQTLLPGETIEYRTRRTKWIFMRPAIGFATCLLLTLLVGIGAIAQSSAQAGAGSGAGGGICATVFVIGCVGYGFMAVMRWLDYNSSEFAVTNKRVIVKYGLIRRRALELQLQKIESAMIAQGILGRILGYGTVEVRGSGGTREWFPLISQPEEFKRQIQAATNK